jgi:hypothetical protein
MALGQLPDESLRLILPALVARAGITWTAVDSLVWRPWLDLRQVLADSSRGYEAVRSRTDYPSSVSPGQLPILCDYASRVRRDLRLPLSG